MNRQPVRGMALTFVDDQVLAALAGQAGLAISHTRLASRIVHAQDAARRRIERNIHDGAQQELVALTGKLGLAHAQVDGDEGLRAVLAESQRDVQHILANLRELAQGIHPSVLSDRGLVAAVEDRCSRAGIEVTMETASSLRGTRFPTNVEAAAYFTVAEALTNTIRHSEAEMMTVRLHLQDETLIVEVADDGLGFDAELTPQSGLQGLRNRIHAVGGEFTVETSPGKGTRLAAELPVSIPERG